MIDGVGWLHRNSTRKASTATTTRIPRLCFTTNALGASHSQPASSLCAAEPVRPLAHPEPEPDRESGRPGEEHGDDDDRAQEQHRAHGRCGGSASSVSYTAAAASYGRSLPVAAFRYAPRPTKSASARISAPIANAMALPTKPRRRFRDR